MVSQYDQTLPGPETPGWSQLQPATALMENTTLEEQERTFGLDIIPLILASALALILGQKYIYIYSDKLQYNWTVTRL